ncbi:RNA ligase [compost metagenome]
MNNAGVAEGVKGRATKPFPSFIPKTDQNRVQNIVPRYLQSVEKGEKFEKTFKLDGSSMTIWIKDGVTGVASRNVSFRLQTENKGFVQSFKDYFKQVKKHGFRHAKFVTQLEADVNAFTQMANNSGVLTALVREGRNLAVQGEMVGPSIQKNFEGVSSNQFYIYDIFDIDRQQYMLPQDRLDFIKKHNLSGVPIAAINVNLYTTVQEAIADADGPSGLNGKYREGVVYKSMERDFSFKVISTNYLLKES